MTAHPTASASTAVSTPTDRRPDSPSTDVALGDVSKHATLAVGAFVILAAVSQIVTVARGDFEVVRAIVAYVDAPKVVLSTGAYFIPSAPPIVILLAIFHGGFRTVLLTVPAATVFMIYATPLVLVISAALPALAFVVWRLWRWRRATAHPTPDTPTHPNEILAILLQPVYVLPMVITVLMLFAAYDRLWVPREVIATTMGSQISGYVLGSSGQSLAVLEAQRRSLILVPEAAVVSRRPCAERDTVFRSGFEFMGFRESRTVVQLLLGVPPSSFDPC